MKPIDYKQTDPKWGKNDYSAEGETATIASAGCGPTCMAMAIASLVDIKVTPALTAKWSLEHKFKAYKQGTYYTYFEAQGKAHGLVVERINTANLKEISNRIPFHQMALDAIAEGDLVICCMGPGHWTKGGHYILWYGTEGMNALINDPASVAANRAKAPISKLQTEVKYYWVVKVPKAAKAPVDHVVSVVVGTKKSSGYLQDGTSYVPVRFVAEAFGAVVGWDPVKMQVTVNGKPIAIVNREGIAYAKSRTLVDMLAISVEWSGVTETVTFKKG